MTASLKVDHPTLVLHFTPILDKLTDEDFFEFCRVNRDLRIERSAEGDLIIMPPTGSETGSQNFKLTGLFSVWVEANGSGIAFDSSTGFTLPNGGVRSPDLAWVKLERWERLTDSEKQRFAPLCPDFVIELRSPNDSLEYLQAKMQEYIDNGAELGWLIDPIERKAYIYSRLAQPISLDSPTMLSGEPVLHGFELKLSRVWEK